MSGHVLGVCPYAASFGGYSIPALDSEGTVHAERTAFRLDAEVGWAIGGAARAGVAARIQLPFSIDFATRYSLFIEPLEEGVAAAALGRTGLELRIFESPEMQLRLGGGLRHFQDGAGGVFGGDFIVGVDLFPVRPLILTGEASVGMVGEAIVAMARLQVGFIVDITEICVGYHYEGLITENVHVDLGGPMLGLRVWL